ncbi:glycosyl transferase family 1 [Aquimarina sp. AD10]|uniref:glycosyltransferase family 4 protein n=1 Tax=Aquimarina sp. AD10 TaxID=1714849 RepID=UPI000E4F3BA1|nr:glycosyltransferase family 4 protein [Aquimarina sp. AD10]AXT59366.1 glycosyl transferase family 1 [Aquimarina sp. AD10]RKM94189.1 glycosyl transferase family 1 [Aquimarina sp. AD10]
MKVLIITYYWPPAGGPGVQRWLKFVKYFREFDIEPIVYVPENPTYPMNDDSLLTDIPKDITIVKHKIFEPYRFAEFFSKKEAKTISKGIITAKKKQSFIQRVLLYIRGNFFIPDARKFWVKPSVSYLKNIILEHDITTVITTGPPHSVHLIGLALQKQIKVKWVADFRDPWTTIGYHDKLKLTNRSIKRHKFLEKEVLKQADKIVVTSYTTAKEFREITSKPIDVITNGFDIETISEVILDSDFTISHIGSLLSGRNPKNLWKALYELTQENSSFAELFKLQLVGAVSDEVLLTIKEAGLSDFVTLKGYVSHKDAILIQRSSQVLLLIEINSAETQCIIPGKLFEYMVSKRPIVALGPKNADIQKLISETNSGYFFEYHEYEELKKQILAYFKMFQQGKLTSNVRNIDKYSRKELTKVMADLLKESK